MQRPSNSLVRIEHDHNALSETVASIGVAVEAIERGERAPDEAYEALSDDVESLVERMVVHFDREEQALFPFIARELPAVVPELHRLESAHDGVCGALLRIASVTRNGADGFAAQWPLLVALFRRFLGAYQSHARDESAFLRDLGTRLDERQRSALSELLEGI